MNDEPARTLRADARRNRTRVLEAAEEVLAERGLGAAMSAIAARAGVGVGTIYRHFPTKEALYQAIVVERLHRLADEAGRLSTADDPGTAFFDFFARVVDESAAKKTYADALAEAGVDVKAAASGVGQQISGAIELLLTRAQRAGAVRDDVTMPELAALLTGTAMAAEHSAWGEDLRRRTLTIVFDGLSARSHGPVPRPPSRDPSFP